MLVVGTYLSNIQVLLVVNSESFVSATNARDDSDNTSAAKFMLALRLRVHTQNSLGSF